MIYGERIRLRALEKDDLPLFVEWLNDPEVTRGVMQYLPISFQDEEDWFDNMRKQPKDRHPMMIEIHQDGQWLPIGDCGLGGIDWRVRSAEFGIVIGDKTQWGKGYGTEASKLMLKHAFLTLNLNRVMLRVFGDNPRARHVYEKIGYQFEGTLRQAHYHHGKYIDIHIMSVLRDEWLERNTDQFEE